MNKLFKAILISILLTPFLVNAQVEIINGVPEDITDSKIIFLRHEKIEIGTDEENEAAKEYIILSQNTHNEATEEYNKNLDIASKQYPYSHTISSPSAYLSLKDQGYKYVLDSELFKYEHLRSQPEEDALIVFEYYLRDLTSEKLYAVFEIDEMMVYDAKLVIKKLNKALEKSQKSK